MYKKLKASYYIQSDGTICNEDNTNGNHITICMSKANTLMMESLCVKDISVENLLKGILTAQTYFLSGFIVPLYSSELETKDESGVIQRFSNMPGRSIERKPENKLEDSQSLSCKISAEADGVIALDKAMVLAAEVAAAANGTAVASVNEEI